MEHDEAEKPTVLLGVGRPGMMLVDMASYGGVYFPGGRDECVLEIDGFQPELGFLRSYMMKIRLKRNGREVLWECFIDSTQLACFPRLIWAENP